MKTYCITIDTEPDCDIHWKRSQPLTFESVLFGIPNILRPIWDLYDIRPVYFVSPEVINNVQCCQVLKNEIKSGAEIGTHLHSEYIEPQMKFTQADGTASNEFPCIAYSDDVEFEKIKNLTDLIKQKLNIQPVSYRAARYGADLATIKSLEKLGYKVDSSVTPNTNWSYAGGPNHSTAPKQPYFISDDNMYKSGSMKILEVPITVSKKRFPFLPDKWLFTRWLRPTHMTVFEMKMVVNEFLANFENPVLNMMFHSMEIIPGKTPFVRTKFGQKLFIRRLEKIIQYIMKKGFKNKTLASVYAEQICAG
ncbi:MAG: hypothetical protein ABSE89_03130 [Sedimentisphaerales bacterium]